MIPSESLYCCVSAVRPVMSGRGCAGGRHCRVVEPWKVFPVAGQQGEARSRWPPTGELKDDANVSVSKKILGLFPVRGLSAVWILQFPPTVYEHAYVIYIIHFNINLSKCNVWRRFSELNSPPLFLESEKRHLWVPPTFKKVLHTDFIYIYYFFPPLISGSSLFSSLWLTSPTRLGCLLSAPPPSSTPTLRCHPHVSSSILSENNTEEGRRRQPQRLQEKNQHPHHESTEIFIARVMVPV